MNERPPRRWNVQIEWKLQDLWVGVFWKRTGGCVDLWVCLIPCVPIHVSWWNQHDPSERELAAMVAMAELLSDKSVKERAT